MKSRLSLNLLVAVLVATPLTVMAYGPDNKDPSGYTLTENLAKNSPETRNLIQMAKDDAREARVPSAIKKLKKAQNLARHLGNQDHVRDLDRQIESLLTTLEDNPPADEASHSAVAAVVSDDSSAPLDKHS